MKKYRELSAAEAKDIYLELEKTYETYKASGIKLDLSRGKPNSEQLDISCGVLSVSLPKEECISSTGFDYRNYGLLDGIPEAKRLFGEIYGLDPESVIVAGNSSLQLMYDAIARAMLFGNCDSEKPWAQEKGLKWICVAPGYDRHFRITEDFGFELLTVKMTPTGPDMDEVERLALDPKVKGMWCIPKYSNPSGNTYSDETVRRLASMKTGAKDFRIMWDNAYAIHSFGEKEDKLLDIVAETKKYGNENRVLYFASTSKVTLPGSGVAIVSASKENLDDIKRRMGTQTIGYDKINQLRHVKYFKNADNVRAHMKRLGSAIKVKFDIALAALNTLKALDIAEWTEPNGGYFISLDLTLGSAQRVYELMKEAGVTLTQVGATYPYGKDPEDKNLRLAPTYPADSELKLACEILTVTVKMSALEKIIAEKSK
ncbi:MAG: aminotransferase class I/II-fold pyridoxal phosphate-dependent enzyme [Ruminococcaceae bacterium]|nr:aminotransferase class I/II-fold pyridoxal phosphate-dependent enzyme [Oscillospiraceae bacterium]